MYESPLSRGFHHVEPAKYRPLTFNLTFDLDDLYLSKNQPLKDTSGSTLHHPTKFGQDRPKNLGGVVKQTNTQTNKQTHKQTNVIQIIV